MLYTNQFKMHIGKNAPQIYQYSVQAYLGEVTDVAE